MTPINPAKYLAGKHRLPAGAVPLATDHPGSVIATTPHNRWLRWWETDSRIEHAPNSIQKQVVTCICKALGGTQAMADTLGVSRRTVEAWRAVRIPVPPRAAETILRALAEKQ
jgi:hypothetical protein